MSGPPFRRPPGLQPERTLLAWRRTALSLGLAAVVVIRLTMPTQGIASVTVGGAGLVLAIVTYLAADRRYRVARRSSGEAAVVPGVGAPAALLAATMLVVGLLAGLYVSQG